MGGGLDLDVLGYEVKPEGGISVGGLEVLRESSDDADTGSVQEKLVAAQGEAAIGDDGDGRGLVTEAMRKEQRSRPLAVMVKTGTSESSPSRGCC